MPHRGAHQTADIGEQGSVSIVEAPEQLGGALDIGQQEGDLAFRQLPLRLQLRADEADGHDPVLLGRPQQPGARTVRAPSSSNATWLNRERAFRTCAAS